MSSSTAEGRREGGQRIDDRWPPMSRIAWNICILFSANDAYLRNLALTPSGRYDTGGRRRSDGAGLGGQRVNRRKR